MATREQLSAALVKADASGNTEDAKVFAAALRSLANDNAPAVNMSVSDRFAALPKPPPTAPAQQNVGERLMDSTAATVNGIVNGIPILGPLAQNTTDMIGGGLAQLTGGDYGEYVRGQQALRQRVSQSAPVASVSGNIAGALGSFGGLAALPGGAQALGITATQPGFLGLLGQTGRTLGSTQAIATVDNMARGDKPMEATINALQTSGLSALVPGASAAVRGVGRGARNAVQPLLNAANSRNAATKAIATNIAKDRGVGARMLDSEAEAALGVSGAPVMNIDRFGESIRRLGRASSNASSEAGAILKDRAQTRFGDQVVRAKSFIGRLMNGATDDLALQATIKQAGDVANDVNYAAARNNPASRAIFNQPIKELMQSDTFRAAINAAESRGTDRAATAGVKAVRNPFEFRPDGSVTLKTNTDGSRALPSLDFWDQVKRNLDRQIGLGKRAGDDIGDLMAIKRKLVSALDEAVPEYKNARGVAASFFDADDAVDAGRKAATSTRQNGEIERAVQQMSSAERDAFSVGYASEIIDMLGERGTRQNVINALFDKPSAMERLRIALGPQKAKEFEAYVRGEQIIDMTRVALSGGSNTMQQYMDLGIAGTAGGLAGYFTSGGNLTQAGATAALFAAGRKGMSLLGKRVDEKVMKYIAEMLSSTDPKDVQRALQNVAMSQKHLDAIKAIQTGLETATRGAIAGAGSAAPVEITVNGGAR